ncbi:ABC transporter ATP-binding protein [Antribacter gilvus]|uniref:ABC transporter ATP-binding protein n=1 Tax=Antribacter gilvus TaxID=2304675 RepID=UPI000F79F7FA|nr:ABC transporter ATP-binding protein [Antribacter gilvus]
MIDVENVTKAYPGGGEVVVAARDVSLRVERGEFVVLAGPSGSGKTTLLNLIGALDSPTSGTIRVDGTDLGSLSGQTLADFRRDHIGFVFQRSNLVSSLPVLENILLQRRLQGRVTAAVRREAEELLERVGLADKAGALPGRLSGGQQQRVAVVRAVASAASVVVADEPTASLDGPNATEVLRLFREINEERGITIVTSSHDERVIAAGRRVVHLVDGAVATDSGDARRLAGNPAARG